jgi:hypothetical protein
VEPGERAADEAAGASGARYLGRLHFVEVVGSTQDPR